MKRARLTFNERIIIEKMYKSGESLNYIATSIGKSQVTIKREINRIPNGQYTAEAAQEDYNKKHKEQLKNVRESIKRNRTESYISAIVVCLKLNPDAEDMEIATTLSLPVEIIRTCMDEAKKRLD